MNGIVWDGWDGSSSWVDGFGRGEWDGMHTTDGYDDGWDGWDGWLDLMDRRNGTGRWNG